MSMCNTHQHINFSGVLPLRNFANVFCAENVLLLRIFVRLLRGDRGQDCILFGFTTTCAVSSYHH